MSRHKILIKRLRVRMMSGKADLDKQPICEGQSRSLRSAGTHLVSFVREDKTSVSVTLNLHI